MSEAPNSPLLGTEETINKSFDQARFDFVAGESTDTEIEIYLGHARPSSLFWWCRGE